MAALLASRNPFLHALATAALSFAAQVSAQVTVEVLPHLGRGGEALAASADGSVIVGMVVLPDGGLSACRWVNGTLQLLPFPAGTFTRANSISDSGAVIVGRGFLGTTGWVALRWDGDVATVLPALPNSSTQQTDSRVSRDGTTVVGTCSVAIAGSFFSRPVKWLGTAVTELPSGSAYGAGASGASNGGSVIVGGVRPTSGSSLPAVWTAAGLATLPTLGSNSGNDAAAVTANGNIIVGAVGTASGGQAARWTSGMLELLDAPAGQDTWAVGISANGAVIIGQTNGGGQIRPVCWINDAYEELPRLSPGTSLAVQVFGVSSLGNIAVGKDVVTLPAGGEGYVPVVWRFCPQSLLGGICNDPPRATNLPFEGRLVTDPDHPLDFTLEIADDIQTERVTVNMVAADAAAITAAGYRITVEDGANPARVRIWQDKDLDLGWAEREWQLRLTASDDVNGIEVPIDVFVHRRSALPPRRLLDGTPSRLTAFGQGQPAWGSQRYGASDDTGNPSIDLARDWISAARAEVNPIPLQNAGQPVSSDVASRYFTADFRGNPAWWIDHPVRAANTVSITSQGSGGLNGNSTFYNVQLTYVSGPQATEYPRATVTTGQGGRVTSVTIDPAARGSGFLASSGTVMTAASQSIGGVTGFSCTLQTTVDQPNGVRGDKNDVLEIVRLVEQRRGNLNLRLIGCCFTSFTMGVNALTTGEAAIAPVEFTPGSVHAGVRAVAGMPWVDRPAGGAQNMLNRWREMSGNPDLGPRFASFGLSWDAVESYFNSQGAKVKVVRRKKEPVTQEVARATLDERKALLINNGHHWRLVTKYDYRDVAGGMRLWISDPGGLGSAGWVPFAQAGSLLDYATLQRNAGALGFQAEATDLAASALGAQRILVTDPLGRRFGIDPVTGQSFEQGDAGVFLNPPLDIPAYEPLTPTELLERELYSQRWVVMPGALVEGTYTVDLETASVPVTLSWRQDGQPVRVESIEPVAAPWGGRATVQVFAVVPCPADLSGDGVVGAADLSALLSAWGGSGAGDLDGNGTVGAADVAMLLSAWGPCGR